MILSRGTMYSLSVIESRTVFNVFSTQVGRTAYKWGAKDLRFAIFYFYKNVFSVSNHVAMPKTSDYCI